STAGGRRAPPPYPLPPLGRAALDFHVRQRDRPYKVVLLGPLTQPGSAPRVSRRASSHGKVSHSCQGASTMTETQERFAAIRSHFAGTSRGPYCDVAVRGLMLRASRAALDRHLDDASEG